MKNITFIDGKESRIKDFNITSIGYTFYFYRNEQSEDVNEKLQDFYDYEEPIDEEEQNYSITYGELKAEFGINDYELNYYDTGYYAEDIEEYIEDIETRLYENNKKAVAICWLGLGLNWQNIDVYRFFENSIEKFIYRDYDFVLYEREYNDNVIAFSESSHDYQGKTSLLFAVTEEEQEEIEKSFDNIYKVLESKGVKVDNVK